MGLFEPDTDIFRNRDALREDYQPEEIVGRDEELQQYISALQPVINGDQPSNIFLYGKAGVGKTACTRYLLDRLQKDAAEYGIDVDDVAPAYTSQRCSHGECGFTHEDNRDDDKFGCLKCGKELHADYNAARNIGWRLVQHWLKSGAGRATSQLALKSGTLNANGQFRPSALRG